MYIVQKVINNINLLKATSTLTTLVVSLNPLKFYIALSMTILENYILFKKKKKVIPLPFGIHNQIRFHSFCSSLGPSI